MDIWKLLGGSSKKPENTPQTRLIRFKESHDDLQLIWRRQNSETNRSKSAEALQTCLQEIRRTLQNEVQTPPPHLCARHVASFHLYSTIAQLAAIHPEPIVVEETLAIFKVLLDSEEGDFVRDKGFADALTGFVSTVSVGALPTDTEAQAVEVLYYVSAKLRLEPQLLSTWFRPSKRGYALPSESRQVHKEREEFLLFYMILDFVHHDGRTGDFARTGLQYLIECGAHSPVLEQWIIESDLASLMASGLGALYSQLSRKLVITHDPDDEPAVITFSQEARPQTPNDADKSSSPEFKDHLKTFLSYLAFWQDVLEHCSSIDVKQSLLDHFKFLFLQQVLYPSLVESSDRDGGSLVAVLTYLKCIIESTDHHALVHLLFEYLLAIPEAKPTEKPSVRPTALARRRRSQSLLNSLSKGQAEPAPDIFNLDDLIMGSLRSPNQQTVVATLRLVSAMLRSHHQYDVSFMKQDYIGDSRTLRGLSSHERNTRALYAIIESIMDEPNLAELYDIHLGDAQNLLEGHPCSLQILNSSRSGDPDRQAESSVKQTPQAKAEDLILSGLIALLEDFFINDIETNLSLTHVFATTISCTKRGLDGWFLDSYLQPTEYTGKGTTSPDDQRTKEASSQEVVSAQSETEETQDLVARNPSTPVFAALSSLVAQIEKFRKNISNFDIYLAERRHVFKIGDESEKVIVDNALSSQKPSKPDPGSRVPVKNSPQMGSISERLMPQDSPDARSPSHSPRGRKVETLAAPHLADRLSQLRQSPSMSPALPATRAISPSPLRKDLASAESPVKQPGTPMGPPDALSQKLRIKVKRTAGAMADVGAADIKSDTSSIRSESMASESVKEELEEVTLSHVLTNVIILQEFVLELVAIVQVRATLFGEVKFD